MKKFFSALLAVLMLCCLVPAQAFAADVAPESDVQVADSGDSIQPYGALSGYGQKWVDAGSPASGSFTFQVTGISWPTAQLTVSLENFDSSVCAQVSLYNPNGLKVFDSGDNGSYITVANSSSWQNIHFANAKTGTYTVKYTLMSITGGIVQSSGRINVWVY